MITIPERIAEELAVSPTQVHATIALLEEGATVPFIARYRKEVTQGLDDTQLRLLEERLGYLTALEERRDTILKSIETQGKLTPELKEAIANEQSKIRLEDLYRPFKPKRRTKGQIASEAGLTPLADALLADPTLDPDTLAADYLAPDHNFKDTKAVLEGARYILMERFAEDPDILEKIRTHLQDNALLQSQVIPEKKDAGQKFQDYFEHQELLKKVPSHRALAMFRGRKEGILQLALVSPETLETPPRDIPQQMIATATGIRHESRPADDWLQTVVRATWRVKIQVHLETELLGLLKEAAETEAILVFRRNLHDLLMAAPAGSRPTLGLDPGLRTGVKLAVVDGTGKFVAHDTIYPHAPRNDWKTALNKLHHYITTHQVELVSIGNGTASRETEKLVQDYQKQHPTPKIIKVVVSEAGASVYSASELAAKEFPDLDVSIRGAVSIARRLQDPLAELVKIEPKAIGVGQYQHDVNQVQLARTLDAVVEDAVNAVGVDVNMASAPLLTRIAGLNQQIAQNIVSHRETNGKFNSRNALKKVPRLGDKAFEQAAGFLRIVDGDNPLDASQVHPEAYPLVEDIVSKTKHPLSELLGNTQAIKQLEAKNFVTEQFGLPTIQDILTELDKPGRDPRDSFQTVNFQDGVEQIKDLKPGMLLEGIVTNVAKFGAFVDIGVHQDGLVHISAMANKFIQDPHEVVKAGQIVNVKVLEIDTARKRISLTMRLDDPLENNAPKKTANQNEVKHRRPSQSAKKPPAAHPTGIMAEALQAALSSKS